MDGDLRGPQVSCAGAHESNRWIWRDSARIDIRRLRKFFLDQETGTGKALFLPAFLSASGTDSSCGELSLDIDLL